MLRYWGKARPVGAGFRCHPLAYHSLDVAAVGAALLDGDPRLADRLALQAGMAPPVLRRWLLSFLAWHDLGKFSPSFQCLAPEAGELLGNPITSAIRPPFRHDAFGHWLLSRLHRQRSAAFARLGDGFGGRNGLELIQNWSAAVTGHHGTPPAERHEAETVLLTGPNSVFPSAELAAAEEFMVASADLFAAMGAPLTAADVERARSAARRASWAIAGFAVLCDWIGSGQHWFCYELPDFDLASYWQKAQDRAVRAVADAGVLPSPAAPARQPRDLLGLAGLRPLQTLVHGMALPDGPLLVLIEELTGTGKTEAAMLLAHRLVAAGRADGVVIALPTMATANAMYDRVERIYRRLFADDATPSMILGHGSAKLRAALLETAARREQDYDKDDDTASAACAAWIADDRRRAFLADVGVVTIDQALLGVLPAKHQSLRLLGLGRKVLVIDEAHAYDEYMREELVTLLTFHAAQGGSALVLSATLPASIRVKLATGFARGLGAGPELAVDADDEAAPYPLVSVLHRDGMALRGLPPEPAPRRDVGVAWLTPEAACPRVIEQARMGRAVCWLRNTVGDAQQAFAELRAAAPDLFASLFHARFAMADRQRIESDVLNRFGPRSKPDERRGRVLVATQVVEQSLDLDFDALVTDLAPIDLLIQRAGRLWRHERPGRAGEPVLEVVAPTWDDTPKAGWFGGPFRRGGFVYRDHGKLWLTMRALRNAGRIVLPQQARALIEAVYGSGSADGVPAGLEQKALQAEGRDFAHVAQARASLLALDDGYRRQNLGWDRDMKVQTRLGEPQIELRLARWDGSTLRPWAEFDDPWLAWRLSEITVAQRVMAGVPEPTGKLAAMAAATREAWPDAAYAPALLPLAAGVDNGPWTGEGRSINSKVVRVAYDAATGLRVLAM